MTSQELNSLGLILNIVGVVLVFFFGFPQPSHEESVGISLENGTVLADGTSVASLVAEAKRRKRRYLIFSNLALTFMLVGFALQLWATWH